MKQRIYNVVGGTIDGQSVFKFGKNTYATRQEAEAAETQWLIEKSEAIGREPTREEKLAGLKEALTDYRNPQQIYSDSGWQPKRKKQLPLSPEEKALQHAIEQREANRLARMDDDDRMVYQAQKALEAKQEEVLAKERERAHLESVKPYLEKVESLFDQERWIARPDRGFRTLLEMAERQLLLPDGDPLEAKRLLHRIDEVIDARRIQAQYEAREQLLRTQERLAHLQSEPERLAATFEVTDLDTKRAALAEDFNAPTEGEPTNEE